MKAYWDSSALVETTWDNDLHDRLKQERAFTRTHSLAEVFSALSGNLQIRFSASHAAQTVKELAAHLDFVDLSADDVIKGLTKAQSVGVRGGRVHDYIHALAAEKAGAKKLLTLDRNDFTGLTANLTIEQV